MDSTKLLIFFFTGFGLTTCSDTNFREYHYVNQSLNWTEAQKYCREKYTDLATIESAEDLSRLNRSSGYTKYVWIGLSDDPKYWWRVMSHDSNSWRWLATGKPSETGYQNWYADEPTHHSGHVICVFINAQGQWLDFKCNKRTHFVCFNESNPPGQRIYTFIKRSLNWTEAQTYCRTHHTDLATIENAQENAEVKSVMTANFHTWIGLYRVPWRWSDNSSSSFKNWASGQPDGDRQLCMVEDSTHAWFDVPCDRKFSFLCYKDLTEKKTTMVRMKIQTFADLSDPATHAQILQQLSERFKALHGDDVKLRWVTQPTKQEEDDDEDKETCN